MHIIPNYKRTMPSYTCNCAQILSNEDKRNNYDRYGHTEDTQPYGSSHYSHRHDAFYFEESFFNFPYGSKNQRDFADSKYILHFNQYVNDVVPNSYRRPYLIKITSDWCFSCIHIEPVWKEVVQEMESLGSKQATHYCYHLLAMEKNWFLPLFHLLRCWNRCGRCWLWATAGKPPRSSSHTINTWNC